jgi:hypothetical protein
MRPPIGLRHRNRPCELAANVGGGGEEELVMSAASPT